MDFEADPFNNLKPLIKKLFASISKSITFPFLTQLKYCQKLDFEADLFNKLKIKKLNFHGS
jgi:hypothetical protein